MKLDADGNVVSVPRTSWENPHAMAAEDPRAELRGSAVEVGEHGYDSTTVPLRDPRVPEETRALRLSRVDTA